VKENSFFSLSSSKNDIGGEKKKDRKRIKFAKSKKARGTISQSGKFFFFFNQKKKKKERSEFEHTC